MVMQVPQLPRVVTYTISCCLILYCKYLCTTSLILSAAQVGASFCARVLWIFMQTLIVVPIATDWFEGCLSLAEEC